MTAETTSDRVLPGGLLGYLEDFEYQKTGSDHALVLRGWVLGGKSRVRSVLVKQQNGVAAVSVPYGLPRPDVAQAYPGDPHAHAAGFGGSIILPRSNSRVAKVEIVAVLDDGREVRCFARSYTQKNDEAGASGGFGLGNFVTTAAQKAIAAYRDGRLSLSPAYWLGGLRAHYYSIVAPESAVTVEWNRRNRYRRELKAFLDSHQLLSWSRENPRLSVILIASRRPELTLRCLRSLQGLSLEVDLTILDRRPSRETERLLAGVEGVRIDRQRRSGSVWPAYRETVRDTRADYVLFLSSDAEVVPGSIEAAVATLKSAKDIGAVGGKVILPGGRLKEAGGIIRPDGRFRYGAGDDPQSPPYMYMRDVDYCSGAFLLTHRELFLSLESTGDVDYCLHLRKAGKRVVYDPRVSVNIEGQPFIRPAASSHEVELLDARSASHPRKKVLVLDDRVPHFRHGAGFPRAVELVRTLDELGNFVTFYPVTMPHEDWSEVYEDIPRTVEVITGWGTSRLREFMRRREGFYDHIIVSRPHNMKTFRDQMWKNGSWGTGARVIYDAEAIFSFREAEQRRMAGEKVDEAEVARLLSTEMGLTQGVHAVFSVTDKERDYFHRSGVARAWTLGHTVALNPTERAFRDRSGFLFVGAMSGLPNRDAVLWFVNEIWPGLRPMLDGGVSFRVVGAQPPGDILAVAGVEVLGQVADLAPFYDRARIFVAPSRLAAGIPIKVQTAAANGLPVVCTSILAEELGWRHEVELLVADDPEAFAKCCARLYSDEELWQGLRVRALHRVAQECSHDAFASTLDRALAAEFDPHQALAGGEAI